MTNATIGLLGGSGFVGSVLANQLVEAGYRVRILTRRRNHGRELWLLPNTDVVEVDLTSTEQLTDAIRGLDAVVNLVGIVNERGDNGDGFREVHLELARKLIKALKAAEVPHLVQMSALNADSFASSYYLRSKGEAEKLLADEHGNQIEVTVFRPSVVFGPRDDFTNRFRQLLMLAPGILPLAAATTRFQPVYVGDLAAAIVRCIVDPAVRGKRYDIGGPDVLSLQEIVEYIAAITHQSVRVVALGKFLSSLQANICEYIPGKPFSRDNLRSLEEDSVCSGSNGLIQLGIEPKSMRSVVPTYLGDSNLRNRYYDFRTEARRDEHS